MSFGGESGLREVGLCGIHPLTRRYVNGVTMKFPDGVVLVHVEALEDQDFYTFAENLNQNSIPAVVNSRPNPGPQACMEWLMPTAIVVGVSTGFLNEMGKDLYQYLKRQLSDLTVNTMKKPRIEPSVYGTSGKINRDNPYSNAFAIYSDTKAGDKFKLLIPKYSLRTDYSRIVGAYLDFLQNYNLGLVSELDMGFDSSKCVYTNTVLVRFNESTNQIEWVNPIQSHIAENAGTE